MFFHTKSVLERRWSTSAVWRVRDGLVCGRIILGSWSDHGRIIVGSVPHCKWGIPLWFATVGSFPQCKWDCKWCWWRSCRWSFGGSLARNAFLRDSICTKPYVFPYKVRPRTSMIYLCGATGARRSRVWSERSRIMFGSVPHCKWGFKCFSCICGRQNSIVICNCRIVPAM